MIKLNTKLILIFMLVIGFILPLSIGCGAPESSTTNAESSSAAGPQEGVITGAKTSTNMTTGATKVHGVIVKLDDGSSVDAYIDSGMVPSIMGGAVVRIEPFENERYAWRVTKIISLPISEDEDSNTIQESKNETREELRLTIVFGGSLFHIENDIIADLLSEKLDKQIVLDAQPSEMALLSFASGELDFALIDYRFFIQNIYLIDPSFDVLLVAEIGHSFYCLHNEYIVSMDSGIDTFEDLKGKTLAYHKDTLGYYQILKKVVDLGYQPGEFFRNAIDVGASSDSYLESLDSGASDVGIFVSSENKNVLNSKGIQDDYIIIETTPDIPVYVIVVSDRFTDEEKALIKKSLLEIASTSEGSEAISYIGDFTNFSEYDGDINQINEYLAAAYNIAKDFDGWN